MRAPRKIQRAHRRGSHAGGLQKITTRNRRARLLHNRTFRLRAFPGLSDISLHIEPAAQRVKSFLGRRGSRGSRLEQLQETTSGVSRSVAFFAQRHRTVRFARSAAVRGQCHWDLRLDDKISGHRFMATPDVFETCIGTMSLARSAGWKGAPATWSAPAERSGDGAFAWNTHAHSGVSLCANPKRRRAPSPCLPPHSTTTVHREPSRSKIVHLAHEPHTRTQSQIPRVQHFPPRRMVPPLPAGEGRGEGNFSVPQTPRVHARDNCQNSITITISIRAAHPPGQSALWIICANLRNLWTLLAGIECVGSAAFSFPRPACSAILSQKNFAP